MQVNPVNFKLDSIVELLMRGNILLLALVPDANGKSETTLW